MTVLSITEMARLYETADRTAEQRDACSDQTFANMLAHAVETDGGEPHADWKQIARANEGDTVPHQGRVLKTVDGMGAVYDWRDSPWTQPNGGRITPVLGVQHIPVVRNVNGYADLITLVEVLQAQGLMVQQATDREGNVGLFTPGNRLCWQARGANNFSWGTEHMHLATSEDWTKRQLRAAAWVNQLNRRHYGTPTTRASLTRGSGVVRVVHAGQTTHQAVAHYAGYNDRSDPGPGFDFAYVAHCEQWFAEHGHFKGA